MPFSNWHIICICISSILHIITIFINNLPYLIYTNTKNDLFKLFENDNLYFVQGTRLWDNPSKIHAIAATQKGLLMLQCNNKSCD